jgi:hypothetical protein
MVKTKIRTLSNARAKYDYQSTLDRQIHFLNSISVNHPTVIRQWRRCLESPSENWALISIQFHDVDTPGPAPISDAIVGISNGKFPGRK